MLPKPSLILYNNRLIAGGALNRDGRGGDDYVSTPFSTRELVARIKAILKRSAGTTASPQDSLALGALRLDRADHSVTWWETTIALTALEFSVLASLDQLTRLVARMRELEQAEMPLARGTSTLQSVLPDLKAQFPQLVVSASGEDIRLEIPAEALGIVLGHLAENSVEHGAKHLALTVHRMDGKTALTVNDDGSGISQGNSDRIFQPFFTTRRASGGTGMGLDIVRAMLEAHGTTIALVPSDQGASFSIETPGDAVPS